MVSNELFEKVGSFKKILLTGYVFFMSPCVLGQEIVPLLQSLAVQQKAEQMKAAPSGVDEPLSDVIISAPSIVQAIKDEKPSEIEKSVAETLNHISLEEKIQSQEIQESLEQFGYSLFSEIPITYSPVANIPVPQDYLLGSGDTLVVQLFGKTNVEYQLVVTRNGRLLIPELGPVQVSGLTFKEVKELLNSRFQEELFGINVSVTMGELQTIRIRIIGEVEKPGSYTVASMTNLMNALFASGGIKRTGSLRNIQLKRNDKIVANFDLYEAILEGKLNTKLSMQHDDVIFVPAIGPTVGVGGEVKRPAIYELKHERSVGEVIQLAGGLLPTAAPDSSHIERIEEGQFYTLIDLDLPLSNINKTVIKPGDLLRIVAVKNVIDKVVLLSGHVMYPGGYQFKKDMRVSHLLQSPFELQANADTQFAILRRELRDQRRIEVEYIDLELVFLKPNSESDLLLKERDEIIVFDLKKNRSNRLSIILNDLIIQSTSKQPPMKFSISGHVRYEGDFPLEYGARLLDVLKVAGGIQVGTDSRYALISRKLYPRGQLEMFSVQFEKALMEPDSEWNPYIHPEDKIFIFNAEMNRGSVIKQELNRLIKQTHYGDMAPVISVQGSVKHTGTFPLEPGMRVSDLIRATGGLKEEAYGLAAELTRYQLIDGEYKIADHHFIDLDRVMKGDRTADVILHAHDFLTFRKKPNWFEEKIVELAGEVVYPGRYAVTKSETLCNVLHRAGGLTNQAYPFGAVFSRQSVRLRQQESLGKVKEQLQRLMMNKHISPGFGQSKKEAPMSKGLPHGNLVDMLKKYKQVDTSGRMVIDLEKIRACDEESDILLEDKDKLFVPSLAYDVSVIGEVYAPGTHAFDPEKGSQDYIDKSGGATQYANNSHAYVIQANGEVLSVRSDSFAEMVMNIDLKPGAIIFVPIDTDRRNTTETMQTWAEIIFKLVASVVGMNILINQ
jgi:protein involved in polysaccharide export with SLBB domain